jgi:hypothetical protein
MRVMRAVFLSAVCVLTLATPARAQSSAPGPGQAQDWQITVYPVLAWVPISIGVDVEVPPVNIGGGGESGGSGDILEGRFDGAFFGGAAASNGMWRIEGYGLWAAVGGDRPDRPFLVVDVDVIYGDAKLGRRIAPDLYVTGGVRRVAFDYDVTLGDLPSLSRKPGLWDPVVGIGWHRIGEKVEWHAAFDGGGFGVGADVDLGASLRVDWKPLRHFGLTAGYNFLYLKVTDTVLGRDVTLTPNLHGPAAGIGFYF